MNILIVDDEKNPLEYLKRTVGGVVADAKITGFMKPSEALAHVSSTPKSHIDMAFLDIEMGGMNGLQLAKRLKDIYGKINIVFTTGYSKYAVDAYALHASGYLMKPISPEAVVEAIDHLRYPVKPVAKHRIRVQTFGNFEVFADEVPLKFLRSKTKELLAYLTMRKGALCTNSEVIAVIWEDRPYCEALQNQYRHLVLDLTKVLKKANAEDIIIRQRSALAIAADKITCDLYDFLEADADAVNNYTGEFMAQYSWAEFTNAYLEKMTRK
ncbi:MAG: response regulator [Oscillospiraceae bacterium]|nr:response regulator [Oscillospiraceae bacterium]